MDAVDPFGPIIDLAPCYWRSDSPMHSPAWRWLRARMLFESKGRASPLHDDAEVRRARGYLQRQAAKDVTPGRRKLGRSDPVIEATLALIADADSHRRSILEAYLLTEASFDAIACRLGLTPELVATYHALFYAVRDKPGAWDWLILHAVGCGPWNEFAGLQPASLLKYFGFIGGARVLEVTIAVITDQPLPAWTRATGKDAFKNEMSLRLNFKTVMALMTARTATEVEKVVEARNQFKNLSTQESGRSGKRSEMNTLMEAFLTGREQPRKPHEPIRPRTSDARGSVKPAVDAMERKSCLT